MKPSNIIVGLDIGTTKICAIVGRMNEFGKIEILSVGKTESYGVMRGVVFNIEKTVQAIHDAVNEAESKAGNEIKSVYVGIAGQHIKSLQHRGILVREDGEIEISRADLKKLNEDMEKLVLPPGEEFIHILPQEYIVDNEPNIKDPVGMCGRRLEANFHIITGQITSVKNIYKCIQKAGLDVSGLILEPIASAEAVLSEEEKEAGVALVDIGGGTTDIAIFQEGIIRHTAVIPLGGNVITEDIKDGCKVMRQQSELLKIKFGSALPLETQDNEIVSIPGLKGREAKEIQVNNLARIIQARMEEILEHAYYEIKSSGYEKKLIGGIVATGGGSQLKHLSQLIQLVTGMDARIGYPTEHIASCPSDEIKNPMYSTGIGLVVLKGMEEKEANTKKELMGTEQGMKKGTSWFEKFIRKTTKLLEEDDQNIE